MWDTCISRKYQDGKILFLSTVYTNTYIYTDTHKQWACNPSFNLPSPSILFIFASKKGDERSKCLAHSFHLSENKGHGKMKAKLEINPNRGGGERNTVEIQRTFPLDYGFKNQTGNLSYRKTGTKRMQHQFLLKWEKIHKTLCITYSGEPYMKNVGNNL